MQKEDHRRGKRAESNESKKEEKGVSFSCVRLGHYPHIAQSHSSVRNGGKAENESLIFVSINSPSPFLD